MGQIWLAVNVPVVLQQWAQALSLVAEVTGFQTSILLAEVAFVIEWTLDTRC